MRKFQVLALIAGTALILTACKREPETDAAVQPGANPLLAHVPAETAFAFATLAPLPKDVTEAYLERFQPVMDALAGQFGGFEAAGAAGGPGSRPLARLAAAVMDEMGGQLSSDSLGRLGIDLQAHRAVYALGLFPVARIGLRDAGALRAAIGRIEAKMGRSLPAGDFNGSPYWRLAEDGVGVGVYAAIVETQLVIGVFPAHAESSLLAAMLGQEMPASSLASSRALAEMSRKKGYSNYGSGFLDLQKLADEWLNPGSETRKLLGPEAGAHLPPPDPVCAAEIRALVAKAPRMTFGATSLTTHEFAMRYDMEIESALAGALAGLVSDTPAALDDGQVLSAALALRVGKLRNFLLERASAVVAAPFECEKLTVLNRKAAEMVAGLGVPMPPMINNLLGIRVRVDELDLQASPPAGSGLVALHVDKPEMFVGMASMLVPGFDELDLAGTKEPVRIPADMLPVEGLQVFAALGDQAIGASIGERAAADLAGFMRVKPQRDGNFFSVSYEPAKQLEVETAMTRKAAVGAAAHHPLAEDGFATAVREAYSRTLGRSRLDMRLTGDGLTIDSRLSFTP